MVNFGSVLGGALGGAVGGASISVIIRAIDQYSGQLGKAQKSFTIFGKSVGVSTIGLTAMGAVAGVAITALAGMVNKAEQFELAQAKFNAQVKNSSLLLKDLNIAAKGTISNLELMQIANKALALGIDENKLPQFLETAAILGQATGRTTAQAFEDINLGIARQSKLILDNLGIIVSADEAYQNYAKTHGLVASALTESQRKAAFADEAFRKAGESAARMGGFTETTAAQSQRLRKEVEDMEVAIGDALIPAYSKLLEVMVPTAQTLGLLAGGFDKVETSVMAIAESSSSMIRSMIEVDMAVSQVEKLTNVTTMTMLELDSEIEQITNSFKTMTQEQLAAAEADRERLGTLQAQKEAMLELSKGIDAVGNSAGKSKDRLQEMLNAGFFRGGGSQGKL